MDDFLIARNPEPDSRLPYLVRIPLGEGVVLKTKDVWPRTAKLYCHRTHEWPEDAEIVVLERSEFVSFANCGLPYHVGGVIEERSALLLQTPQSLGARFGLDVRVGHEVVGVDRDRHVLRVRDRASGREEARGYDGYFSSDDAHDSFIPLAVAASRTERTKENTIRRLENAYDDIIRMRPRRIRRRSATGCSPPFATCARTRRCAWPPASATRAARRSPSRPRTAWR